MSVTNEEARDPAFGPGFFRAFQVTATVYLPRGAPLPTTANEWFDMVNSPGSGLDGVVERRFPLCDDIVDMRKRLGHGPVYG